MSTGRRDAVVVGAGPNGLAAAVMLALHDLDVLVVEARDEPGGGARSAELTRSGFVHDVCSAVHPLAAASPFLSGLPLGEHGLEWVRPPLALAHPLDGGRAALLHPSLDETAAALGSDGPAYRDLLAPLVHRWESFVRDALAPPLRVPSSPLLMARFGWSALRSATGLLGSRLGTEEGRALLAGCAAHSFLPLERPPSAAVGLVLAAAGHGVGWPIPRGGSGRLAGALVSLLDSLGVEIRTSWPVEDIAELPDARGVLLDLTPRQVARVARSQLPDRYLARLDGYRYGPAAYKVDWALDGPVPWAVETCGRAATVHLGGTLEEVASSERAPWEGQVAERPFVLFSEPTRFDPERAPEGKHVAWAYCHVPHGYDGPVDVVDRIERQVERFAPGFRDLVLERSIRDPAQLEAGNANLVGGDINGGVQDLRQLFFRPVPSLDPYATPTPGLYLCSSSTPPGGGVHGMCGYWAARSALKKTFGIEPGR